MSFLPREFQVPAIVETARFRMRSITIHDAFKDYDAVMSLDEKRLLGCIYVDPPHQDGTDADIWFWARQSELASGLESELQAFLLPWLADNWPFSKVALNGAVTQVKGRAGAGRAVNKPREQPE